MAILTERKAEDFLQKAGLPIVQRFVARSISELEAISKKIRFPLVLKNTKFLHKTEKNAVRTDVYKNNLQQAYQSLRSKEVLVQKQIKGIEFIMGVKKDPAFGQVIVVGLGGIFTEVFKDTSCRVLPISRKDAKEMISELQSSKLFNYRGQKYSRNKLIDVMLKINALVEKYPQIKELDMNPIIVSKNSAIVVDARIILDKPKRKKA